MKKILVAFALAAVASVASAQVAGSRHDFVSNGMLTPVPQHACRGCHTPHGATMDNTIIWAQTAFTTAGYTVYTGGGTVSARGVGACLSCHASNTYTGIVGTMATAAVGSDLQDDHPVGSGFTVGVAPDFQATIILGGVTVAAGTEMACSTCHSVHNINADATTQLLYTVGTAGATNICNGCHNK